MEEGWCGPHARPCPTERRGLTTSEIAASLFLSAHTVRDYIKSIFEKVGVNSRGELVGQLFAEHYAPQHYEKHRAVEV